jgi:tRNA pseudouridine38-40 synthase
MIRNFKLTLAYDGSEFHGWQIQPDRPTIQGTLAEVIGRITGENVLPQGSGRTDAGVHALAQVASVKLAAPIPCKGLQNALNNSLPLSVRVTGVEEVGEDFHARHSAKAKTYRYRVCREGICLPWLARYVHHDPYPMDEDAVIQAAELVIGEHDFTSFAAVDPDKAVREGDDPPAKHATNVRTVYKSAWTREGDEFVYEVRGNGFLHHMVRNLVGTFLLVGKGTLAVEDVKRILDARDRSAAGATASASGLWLVNVEY